MTTTPNDSRPSPLPSVSRLAAPLVQRLIAEADQLRLGIEREANGAVIVDAGIARPGGIEAGRRIAEICMGGLGRVAVQAGSPFAHWPWMLSVTATDPVLACLGSQYGGWSLTHGDGDDAFFALGSGPGRALAAQEALFEELGYRDAADSACLVLETGHRPPAALLDRIAAECGVAPDRLTVILTPTESLAGTTQVVARVLEVALHKVHALGFPLDRVVDGAGAAPLPPPSPSFLTAMGRTNDAILYGGIVQLFLNGPVSEVRDLAEKLPSAASRDHGKPFAETFAAYNHDFYAIDSMLFSPARVIVTALETGESFRAGAFEEPLLDRSFADGA